MQQNHILDCSGMISPLPVSKTKKTINSLKAGQVLKMISTDPESAADITAWIRRTNNKVLKSEERRGTYTFYIKKAN